MMMAGPFEETAGPSDLQLREMCHCPPEQENEDEWISVIGKNIMNWRQDPWQS